MASPISIYPSFDWQGSDGNWSTFAFEIGNPQQQVKLLPATSGSSFWPIHLQGCQYPTDPNLLADPEDCPDLRGGLFNVTASTSFEPITPADGKPYVQLPFAAAEVAIGYNGTAAAGLDSVRLGTDDNAILLEHALVAATARKAPLFLGVFGLSNYSSHVRSLDDTDKTPLQMLKDNNHIPSSYYAYHAGAYYNEKFASLTFGGYDENRGNISGGLRVGFGDSSDRDLLVQIKGIRIGSGSASTSADDLPSAGISAFVDSAVPEIWLPAAGYTAFEEAFDLADAWNETLGYYIISDELHNTLSSQNKEVVFSIAANSSEEAPTRDIVLPYAAFDMSLGYGSAGILDTTTTYRYFPLRRAENDNEIILGRTFLQAAYLAVNYETREFFLTQADNGTGSAVSLKCVGAGCDSTSDESGSGLSTGAIAGIAVAAALIVLGIIAFFVWRRWSRKRKLQKFKSELTSRASIGGTTIQEEENQEYFKPPPPEVQEMKPELEGNNTTLGGFHQYGRHELASSGTTRRYSGQSGLTRNSAAVSPLGHHRGLSYESSNDAPSPRSASDGSPSPGQDRWSGGSAPQQQMSQLQPGSGGGWYFELSADSRPQDVPLPTSPRTPNESSNLMGAAPMEVSSDPRSPVEDPRSADSRIESSLLDPRTERRS